MVALVLCGISAFLVASIMVLFAQNRAENTRGRSFADVQNSMSKVFGTTASCTDAVSAAAAAAQASGSPWTAGAGTLQMSKLTAGKLTTLSASSGTTFVDMYTARALVPNDPSTYIKRIYLTNRVASSTFSNAPSYYQAYVDVVSPPPPISGGTYVEARAKSFRPLLIGTVLVSISGGAASCYQSSSGSSTGSGTCSTPTQASCPAGSGATGFDSGTKEFTCAPQFPTCFFNANLGASPAASSNLLDRRQVGVSGSAVCGSAPTIANATASGFSCGGGETLVRPLNCINSAGTWMCSVWCAKINCQTIPTP